eukprot:2047783-Lingulodinium_polyedra.AAC.1
MEDFSFESPNMLRSFGPAGKAKTTVDLQHASLLRPGRVGRKENWSKTCCVASARSSGPKSKSVQYMLRCFGPAERAEANVDATHASLLRPGRVGRDKR